jgi:hypothetical protein
METGLVSNQDFYDEDVNVYLAHLLHSFINPDYVEQSKKYLSKYDADVFKRLATSTDARLKYSIYKTNADFLLVSIGIFDNPIAPTATPLRTQPAPAEEAYIGRGKTYYHFAYTYAQQVHRKNQGVSEVLEKLSVGFEKYIKILSHMRGEYLDLVQALQRGRGLPPRARGRRIGEAGPDQGEAGPAARALLAVATGSHRRDRGGREAHRRRDPGARAIVPLQPADRGRSRRAPAGRGARTVSGRAEAAHEHRAHDGRSTESTATGVAPEKRPRTRRKKSD